MMTNAADHGNNDASSKNPMSTLRTEIQRSNGCSDKDLSNFDFELIDGEEELEFQDCLIRNTRIKGDVLIGSTWRNCKFFDCEFIGTNLRDARFDGCVFFESATSYTTAFRFCDLKRAKFTNCNLSLVKITGCEAYGVLIEDCRMRGAEVDNTKFVQAAGKRRFSAAKFKTSQLVDAIFDKLDLSSCEFDGCNLSYTTFQGARMVNTVMRDCDLQNIETSGADLSGADLRGSDLSGFRLPGLKAHAGLMVSAGQQHHLLHGLGIDVSPDGD